MEWLRSTLVVGTDTGDLLVYKGGGGQVWRRCGDLGFITAVGELTNIKTNLKSRLVQ